MVFEVVAGPYAGQTIQYRNWLRTEALWALRRTLGALESNSDSRFRIDSDKLRTSVGYRGSSPQG